MIGVEKVSCTAHRAPCLLTHGHGTDAGYLAVHVTAGIEYNGTQFLRPRRASLLQSFSYDNARAAAAAPSNSPPRARRPDDEAVLVTASGQSFGGSDYSLALRVGLTGAERSVWTSDTTLTLGVAAGSGAGLSVCATVGGANLTLAGSACVRACVRACL